jgi:hypothetical protein
MQERVPELTLQGDRIGLILLFTWEVFLIIHTSSPRFGLPFEWFRLWISFDLNILGVFSHTYVSDHPGRPNLLLLGFSCQGYANVRKRYMWIGKKYWAHCSKAVVDVMIKIFCDFRQFSAKVLKFFWKPNVIIKFLHNVALFWVKNANF